MLSKGRQQEVGHDRRVQLVNALAWLDAASAAVFSVILWRVGAGPYAAATLLVGAAFLVAPLFNRKGLFAHAQVAVVGVAYLSIFVYSGALGPATHVQILFLPAAATGLAIFGPRSAPKLAMSILAPLALFVAVSLGAASFLPRYPLPADAVPLLAMIFDATAIVVGAGVIGVLNRENRRHLSDVARRSQQELDAALAERQLAVAQATAEAERVKNRELTRAMARLADANARLEVAHRGLQRSDKMAALGQLAGGVAHDFNNMLMAVQNFIGFAHESLPASAEAVSDLIQAEQAVERATTLSRQLLQFSRQSPSEVRVIDTNALVERVRDMLARIVGHGVALEAELDPSISAIEADAGHLEQVLVNLCLNARDAMPDGGRIVVRTRQDEGYVCIAVEDDGVGMTDEVKSRVFEPFFTTKSPGKGTGLGLATCYAMVTNAGGRIEVESEPGEGTTLTLALPVARAEALGVPQPTRREPSRPGQGELVVLAEDDEVVRISAQRVLERAGYEVRVAARGHDALAVARSHPPDILLADIVMPGMSGPRLADEMRRLYPRVKVLLMTGCTEDDALRRGAAAGKFDVLRKPVLPERLIESVREALHSSAGFRTRSLEAAVAARDRGQPSGSNSSQAKSIRPTASSKNGP